MLYPTTFSTQGGGAIVALSQLPDWFNHRVHVTRIVEDPEPLTIRHANTWELLSLLAALQINSEFPAPIFSDCESAVNSLLHINDLAYWRKITTFFYLWPISFSPQPPPLSPGSKATLNAELGVVTGPNTNGGYSLLTFMLPPLSLSFNYITTDNQTVVVTPTIQLIPPSSFLRSLLSKATYHWADSTPKSTTLEPPGLSSNTRNTLPTGIKTTNLV